MVVIFLVIFDKYCVRESVNIFFFGAKVLEKIWQATLQYIGGYKKYIIDRYTMRFW